MRIRGVLRPKLSRYPTTKFKDTFYGLLTNQFTEKFKRFNVD